ncbi:MAG: peptidase M16, partial [Anaerolineales bacterium]
VTVVLEPDAELGDRRTAEEHARLEAARAHFDEGTLQKILEQTAALRLRQETPDSPAALATIPRLQLSDIEKSVRTIPLDVSTVQEAQLLHHDLFTNDILYLDLAFDLHPLPQRLIPYLSLFGRALREIGTEQEDYIRLAQRIGRLTGGFSTGNLLSSTLDAKREAARFTLRGKATLEHVQDLLDLLGDLLLTVQFDNQARFKQMVLEAKARREASLIPAGHQVVNRRLRAAFNVADALSEQISGIDNLIFLRELVERIDRDWNGVLADLEEIRRRLIHRSGLVANVTLAADAWRLVQPQVAAFLGRLPDLPAEVHTWQRDTLPENEGLVIPAQVNYVGKGANLFDLGYELHGSMLVVNKYLQTTWLWEKVRVQGGAYGAFGVFDQLSGVYTYISYRDPNLSQTLDIYDRTAQFLRQVEIHADELTKSIIGVISDLDSYQLPDAKGYTSMVRYLVGMDDTRRQRLRDQILATTADDFRRVADILAQVAVSGRVVVLGSEKALQTANQEQPGWLTIQRVL